jgi:hypothetical protein
MATVEIDPELLRQTILPGLRAGIDSAAWRSDQFGDVIALEVSGEDVPDCKLVPIVFTQTHDAERAAVRLTAVIKPVEV